MSAIGTWWPADLDEATEPEEREAREVIAIDVRDLRRLGVRQWGLPGLLAIGKQWRFIDERVWHVTTIVPAPAPRAETHVSFDTRIAIPIGLQVHRIRDFYRVRSGAHSVSSRVLMDALRPFLRAWYDTEGIAL